MVYKLVIAYDGSAYHGWQVQPNGISIQFLIEKALSTVASENIRLIGPGRTDAGVHALGQVAHFKTEKVFSEGRLQYSLNSLLPKDIRILSIQKVADDFHAQYSAQSKVYRYHLHLNPVLSPFCRHYAWHMTSSFDLEILKKACTYFIGTYDFIAFANEAHKGVAAYDSIRTIKRIDIIEKDEGIALEFEADGFLYKMVRNMVGVLVECATGKKLMNQIPEILMSKKRRYGGMTAPPQGLFLVSVNYTG